MEEAECRMDETGNNIVSRRRGEAGVIDVFMMSKGCLERLRCCKIIDVMVESAGPKQGKGFDK